MHTDVENTVSAQLLYVGVFSSIKIKRIHFDSEILFQKQRFGMYMFHLLFVQKPAHDITFLVSNIAWL